MKKDPKQQQGQYDDVEYSAEVADAEDKEAMKRMQQADQRAAGKKQK